MNQPAEGGALRPALDPATDPLAGALAIAARLLGEPASVEGLIAGLPLEAGRLTPALLARAGARAGLNVRLRQASLGMLETLPLPAVLILKDGGACVLVGFEGDAVRVVHPDAPESEQAMPREALAARYGGQAALVGRALRFEAGTASERIARTHHWFWGTLRQQWTLYAEVVLAAGLINVFAVLTPLFFMNVYDRVVPHKVYETLWVLAAGIALVYVFDLALKVLRGLFIDVAGQRADLALSAALYARVMDLRLDQPRQPVGSLANNLREFDSLRDFFTSATLAALVDLPFVLFFLVVVWLIGGPWMALVPLAAIPLVLGAGFALQAPLRDRIRRVFKAAEAKHAAVIETLGAIEQVKTLGAAPVLQRRWEDLVEYIARESLGSRMLSALAVHFAAFIQLLVSVATIIVGVYLIGDNQLTLGALIACNIIAGRAIAPLAQVAALLTRYHQAMSALEALNAIMTAPVERPRDRQFVRRPRFAGEIQFREVSFRYPGEEVNALNRVSFTVRAGQRVGVIGRVGSGKSTFAKLLVGLYAPTEGSILVDGIEVRQIDPADLRRNVGYLAQNLVLFSGSVRDNLVLGAPQADDAAILRAAALSGLDEHIRRHPRGFDMPVGERGEALSGGQRQAVALARTLILDPPILLLDEPTHASDQSTEDRIKARLAEELAGRTLLLITHRESLLSIVDSLLVFDRGRIVAQGPKDAVIKALAEGRVSAGA
jgi:ATP-binding cassette subfamily C protein LapB